MFPRVSTTPIPYSVVSNVPHSSQYLALYIYIESIYRLYSLYCSIPREVSFYISIWEENLLLFIFMGCACSLLLRSSSVSTRLGLLLIFHVNLNQSKEKDILAIVLHYSNKSFSNIVLPWTKHFSIVFKREISIFHFL